MTQYIFANNVNTSLFAAITSTATSLTLLSATNLPTLAAGQVMPLTLNDAATGQIYEILYVTAISGATLTVQRAQEGTAAQAWAIGDYAKCMPTAQSVEPAGGNPAQVFQVATAVTGTQAVPLAQAQADFAALNGSSAQPFNVASASTSTEALSLGQAQADFAALSQFSNSLAVPGDQYIPGGLISQWGTATVGGAGTTTISFPTAFPSACLFVVVWNEYAGTGTPGANSPASGAYTASSFALGTTQASTVGWLAFGH